MFGRSYSDPLSGRVYVYQAMRVTGSGDPRTKSKMHCLVNYLKEDYYRRGSRIPVLWKSKRIAAGQVGVYDEGFVAKGWNLGRYWSSSEKCI